MHATTITRADILPPALYAQQRDARRRATATLKANRRVAVGPDATFYFENAATMLHQIHEMLHIEQGGEAQIDSELEAYTPLVPNGHELIATLMFEIPDPERRARTLAQLGGVEQTLALGVGDLAIAGQPIGDEARTRADGKTSAVHFIRFALPAAAITRMKTPQAVISLSIAHPHYSHLARLPETVRSALALDLNDL